MITWISDDRAMILTAYNKAPSQCDPRLFSVLEAQYNALHGAEAAFIKNSGHPSKYGLKLFCHKHVAVFTYGKQKKLAKMGLAPRVFNGLIRVKIVGPRDSFEIFGFLTEIVTTKYLPTTEYGVFFKKLSDHGANNDIFSGNTGVDSKNRPVLLDTGTHSFGEWSLCR